VLSEQTAGIEISQGHIDHVDEVIKVNKVPLLQKELRIYS